MGFNLVVWAWADGYQTAAERRKKKVKYGDVMVAFAEKGDHPAMREFDFAAFEAAVETEIGPEAEDGPYLLERYPRARNYCLSYSQVPHLVGRIGMLARRFGLTSAEC